MIQKLNPIVKRVVDRFKTIQQIAEVFVVVIVG